ncbi:putative Ig domain-containing protein, partial [Staphylococcus devriesei]|uniref:putative Ig domain-containing protein n=1 Tax=Staphylococcus devriesei TaxID=586733 RepID=UPI001F480E51
MRHAGISQLQNTQNDTIKLNLTSWLKASGDFTSKGKINLSFAQSDFYTQIDSITIGDGVKMQTTNNGQNWTAPINGDTVQSGLIGVVRNNDVVIKLKNAQTVTSLGYSNDKPVYLVHTWTNNNGEIAEESMQVATITPTIIDKAPQSTQSTGFTTGKMVNKIKYDDSDKTIKSIHTFKPNENFLQSDYNWVLYVKEQVNKELIPYIDPNSVKIYVSNDDGIPISSDRYVNGTIDSNGFFDSSTIPSISIKSNNTMSQLNSARGSLDRNVFYGTLGQSRSYTIAYKLKSGYNLTDLAAQLSDRETFQSWIETDYLDSNDNGAANKRLAGSYATSYIDLIDRIAPVAPTANNITSETKTINGTAEANTSVKLNFNDGRQLTGQADNNGNFSVAVPTGFVLTGKETIAITSVDKGNNISPATTITVRDTTLPSVTSIQNQTNEINEPITPIVINTTDNSGDAVTNIVNGLPAGLTFNSSTNTIEGTPTKLGSYPIIVTSTDSSGNRTTTPFTINVVDTKVPTVASIDNQNLEVNTDIDPIVIKAEDNSGQPVTNTVSGLPNGVTFDSETDTISGTPTKVGSYEVTVTSKDTSGNPTNTTFTIGVKDTTKPVVTSIANQTKEVNTDIDPIVIKAEDNSGGKVINTVSGLPDGVTFDSETDTISGAPTKVGSYDVTVTSTDAEGNSTNTTFKIDVKDTTKPVVTNIGNQSLEVNTAIEPVVIKADDNSGQPVTNTVTGLPTGVTFDATSNTISGTPTKVGSYDVTVRTTDASGNSTNTTFTIGVKDTTKPVVTSIASQNPEVNTAIEPIVINAKDNSGQKVTNTVSGLPTGVTFDSETDTISGRPTTVGSYDVTVTTTDASGNSTNTTFKIDVKDTTDPTV